MTGLVTRGRVLTAILLVLLFCLGVGGYQTWVAASSLLSARGKADKVEELIRAGDFDAATREIARFRDDTHRAEDATDGLLWDLAGHLPLVGENARAVQTVSSVLDTVARENTPVALELARAVDRGDFRPKAGRIDLAAVSRLSPQVSEAAASITAQQRRLQGLDLDKLTFPFDEVVRQLGDQVGRAQSAASSAATAFELLPGMLGADGPRRYLLMIQNNAEIRATGGIPGSVAVLHADHGRIRMGFQGSAGDVRKSLDPARVLSPEELAVYGTQVATDFRDVTAVPDFPTAADLAARMFKARRGKTVDGVLSVDPVALAYLLRGTGPVDVTGARLQSGNVVQVLLNRVYQDIAGARAQDDFFQKAARSIFSAVMAGQGNQRLAITGLATAASQHRVLVWSRHQDEQDRLRGTAVAGELTPPGTSTPRVGVYLDDATAGKPEYYLDYAGAVTATGCGEDGSQSLETTVDLHSTMPKDFSALSWFITGTGAYAPKGTIAFNLRLYGPVAGEVETVTVDGRQVPVTADRLGDRQVAVVPMSLTPGQQVRVQATMRTGPGQRGEPVLSLTPGVKPLENGVHVSSACD